MAARAASTSTPKTETTLPINKGLVVKVAAIPRTGANFFKSGNTTFRQTTIGRRGLLHPCGSECDPFAGSRVPQPRG